MKKMNNKQIAMAAVILFAIVFSGCEKEKYLDEPGNLVHKTVDQD